MGRSLIALAAVALFVASGIDARRKLQDPLVRATKCDPNAPPCQNYKCTRDYITGIPLDHFETEDQTHFQMQILYNTDYYKDGGPLFFYTGNEGAIGGFADNTGVMWNLAQNFSAAIVFAEHRYYGWTQPYKQPWTDAIANKDDVEKISPLDVRQVLEDYAYAIPLIKAKLKLRPSAPVISFGGSYGGMLTTWFAEKYPHLLAGSWAASAPVVYFKGAKPALGAFDAVTKRTYLNAGCSADAIAKGFAAIKNLGKDAAGRDFLEQIFNVNDTISHLKDAHDADDIKFFVREALEYMAMTDYPYKSNFLKPLPAWPVNEACKYLKKVADHDKTNAWQLANATLVYYGRDTKHCVIDSCPDEGTAGLNGCLVRDKNAVLAWPWQECTQMTIYSCAQGGSNDLFWADCNAANFVSDNQADCRSELGQIKGYAGNDTDYKPYFVRDEYGYTFPGLRNVIFTNGYLDPWSAGGVTVDNVGQNAAANGVYLYTLENAAHHLDLREPNTCDPVNVKAARYQIAQILKCWVGQRPASECANAAQLQWALPKSVQQQTTNCVKEDYPWGQAGTTNPAGSGSSTTAQPKSAGMLAVSSTVLGFSIVFSLVKALC